MLERESANKPSVIEIVLECGKIEFCPIPRCFPQHLPVKRKHCIAMGCQLCSSIPSQPCLRTSSTTWSPWRRVASSAIKLCRSGPSSAGSTCTRIAGETDDLASAGRNAARPHVHSRVSRGDTGCLGHGALPGQGVLCRGRQGQRVFKSPGQSHHKSSTMVKG